MPEKIIISDIITHAGITMMRDDITAFLKMPAGPRKNLLYSEKINGHQFPEENILKMENGDFYYSKCYCKVKKGKNGYFLFRYDKIGFSVKNKKLSLWFGNDIMKFTSLMNVFVVLKMEWVEPIFIEYMSKSLLEKILTGKITNPIDFFRAYIKLHRLQVSPVFLYKAVHTTMMSGKRLPRLIHAFKNGDHFLMDLVSKDSTYNKNLSLFTDLIEQAFILEKKIDVRWSVKRLNDEHLKWTKEIMDLKSMELSDQPLEFLEPIKELAPAPFKLLTTEKEVYLEGKVMNHCVYTNYWSKIKYKNYMVFSINLNNERATLGLHVYGKKVEFNQMMGKNNKIILNSELKEAVNELISTINKHTELLPDTQLETIDF